MPHNPRYTSRLRSRSMWLSSSQQMYSWSVASSRLRTSLAYPESRLCLYEADPIIFFIPQNLMFPGLTQLREIGP